MKLYKYRSLSNIELVLDILVNQRLYCAQHDKLKDPLEGVFWYMFQREKHVKRIEYDKNNHKRVCSLSKGLNDIRLWSYYAEGHQGVAIEINLDNNDLHQVDYQLPKFRDIFRKDPNNIVFGQNNFVEKLNKKVPLWHFEEEYRIITFSEYYEIKDKITGVYLGFNIQEIKRELLLKLIPPNIPVYATDFDCDNLKVIPGQRVR